MLERLDGYGIIAPGFRRNYHFQLVMITMGVWGLWWPSLSGGPFFARFATGNRRQARLGTAVRRDQHGLRTADLEGSEQSLMPCEGGAGFATPAASRLSSG